MKSNKFDSLLEQAKINAKNKICKFAKGIYDIDSDTIQHLSDIPVVERNEAIDVFKEQLKNENFEYILNKAITNQIGKEEAVYIPFYSLLGEFQDEYEKNWDKFSNMIDNNKLNKSNAFIVYDREKIKENYNELYEPDEKTGKFADLQKIEDLFLKDTTKVFIHEYVHYNVDTFAILDPDKNIGNEENDIVNGISSPITNISDKYSEEWKDRNEVFVDVFARMINNYEEGYSIEDCLSKVIEERAGINPYADFDDMDILSLYVIFPDEMSDYAMLGSYEEEYKNIPKELYKKVFDTEGKLLISQILSRANKYFETMDKSNISPQNIQKRKKMLDTLKKENILESEENIELKEDFKNKLGNLVNDDDYYKSQEWAARFLNIGKYNQEAKKNRGEI